MQLILTFLLCLATCTLSAQLRIGIMGGANLANVRIDANQEDVLEFIGAEVAKSRIGYRAGIFAQLGLGERLAIEPGVFVSEKGARSELLDSTVVRGTTELLELKSVISPLYIEVPVNLVFKQNLGPLGLRIHAGPYLGYGFGGENSVELTAFGETNEEIEKISWGSEVDDDLELLDYGVNLGIGAELKNLVIHINYGLGLANTVPPESFSDITVNNRVLSLSIGYLFGLN